MKKTTYKTKLIFTRIDDLKDTIAHLKFQSKKFKVRCRFSKQTKKDLTYFVKCRLTEAYEDCKRSGKKDLLGMYGFGDDVYDLLEVRYPGLKDPYYNDVPLKDAEAIMKYGFKPNKFELYIY